MQRSCEVRLWWRGEQCNAVARWFDTVQHASGDGRIEDAAPPTRTDIYLYDPAQTECGIKVRAAEGEDRRVEIKSLIARRGLLAPLGQITLWTKLASAALVLEGSPTIRVQKQRRLQSFAWTSDGLVPIDAARDGRILHAGCNVEWTRVIRQDRPDIWWTLGYEAFGDLDDIEKILRHCVFVTTSGTRIPDVAAARAGSYPEWLAWQHTGMGVLDRRRETFGRLTASHARHSPPSATPAGADRRYRRPARA